MDNLRYKINDTLIKAMKYIKDYSKNSAIDPDELDKLSNELNKVLHEFRLLTYYEDCNKVNILTKNQIIDAYNKGYIIQRCLVTNKHRTRHWGTLRKCPKFDNDEYSKYIYRVVMKSSEASRNIYVDVTRSIK